MMDAYQPERGRMAAVQTPVIPVIAELIAEHPGTISLGQGVVFYGPPRAAIDRLADISVEGDIHRYGHTSGMPELRQLISEKLKTENRIEIDKGSSLSVTSGSNMAFMNALFAITRPGDEIILSVPYYFNHEMAVRMLSCTPVLVETGADYLPDLSRLRRAVTEKTRAIVTITPNNPTGVIYPASLLKDINTLCRDTGLYHISDEAYEYFTFDGRQHFSAGSLDHAAAHTISLFSLSKAYGFASWRIGYMVYPENLTTAIYKAQDTNLICPAIASQYAALGALETGAGYCHRKLDTIREVRQIILEQLESVQSLCTVSHSEGAFYLIIKLKADLDDMDLARTLICRHGIAVLPGSTFGLKDGCYFRVAYGALDKNNAREGIRRLTDGLTDIMQ